MNQRPSVVWTSLSTGAASLSTIFASASRRLCVRRWGTAAIGRPTSDAATSKSCPTGGVNMRMERAVSRNSVPISVAEVRFCRSLCAADTLLSCAVSSAFSV